jgi:hypothetical protein
MHRLFAGAPGMDVDHINGNGLDNRRCNLRPATRSQNNMNRAKRRGVSKFKGVSPKRGKWRAYLKTGKKQHNLGVFESEYDAARAYDVKAKEMFGEFARVNFPENA